MPKHNFPANLSSVFLDLFSRLESLERRPRFGIERITVTEDTTLDPVTRYVWVNSAGDINVVLPDQWDGATVTFKNQVAVTVTISPTSGTIDGLTTSTVFGLNTVVTYQSDGTNWITL